MDDHIARQRLAELRVDASMDPRPAEEILSFLLNLGIIEPRAVLGLIEIEPESPMQDDAS